MNLHEIMLAKQPAGANGGGNVDLSDYYTKSQTDDLISEKVDKIDGKGLSTNDFTTALKNKLNGLQNYNDTPLKNEIKAAVGWNSKNLMPPIIPETDQYINGVTFIINDDGTVIANGTADSDIILKLSEDITEYQTTQLILSGCPQGGNYYMGYALYVADVDFINQHFVIDTGWDNIFSIPPHVNKWSVYLVIRSGVTVNNLTFEPMVRLAEVIDPTFESYKPNLQKQIDNLSNQINGDIKESISFGANLNDYIAEGVYYADENTSATLSNCPAPGIGFRLEVVPQIGTDRFM